MNLFAKQSRDTDEENKCHMYVNNVLQYIKQLMRTYCIIQGTLLNALWGPKREGSLKKRGYTDPLCYTAETNKAL